jgi:hypothetical protein
VEARYVAFREVVKAVRAAHKELRQEYQRLKNQRLEDPDDAAKAKARYLNKREHYHALKLG